MLELTPYDAAVRFVAERINFERTREMPYRSRQIKLERMGQLLARLGNPQDKLAIVHITGTKGKGSTAATLSSLLRACGYRTGLFTSPHLEFIEERFVVDGQLCTQAEMTDLVGQIRPAVEAMDRIRERPTFFEIVNAMAYLHFLQKNVDWVVLEVGLGGRLDSTNVCLPRLCIITNISFDHTKQLGNTLAAIAQEKAGIIKRGIPVLTGAAHGDPRRVIGEVAARRQAPLYVLGEDFHATITPPTAPFIRPQGSRFTLTWETQHSQLSADSPAASTSTEGSATGRLSGNEAFQDELRAGEQPVAQLPVRNDLELQLCGEHQVANAALAVAALDYLHRHAPLPDSVVRAGLAQVRCTARVQVMSERPLVLLDTAHNVASAQALAQVLQQLAPRPSRRLFLTATQGKDLFGMLLHLLPCFDHVVISRYADNSRSFAPHELYELAVQVAHHLYVDDWEDDGNALKAESLMQRGEQECQIERPGRTPLRIEWHADGTTGWEAFRQAVEPDDLACITGSFFFVAEARRLLQASGWPIIPDAQTSELESSRLRLTDVNVSRAP